jgi:hypothetical protein
MIKACRRARITAGVGIWEKIEVQFRPKIEIEYIGPDIVTKEIQVVYIFLR